MISQGYAAPECVLSGQLSKKVETYSIGIVVREMLSGRRINDLTTDIDSASLHLLARENTHFSKVVKFYLFIA